MDAEVVGSLERSNTTTFRNNVQSPLKISKRNKDIKSLLKELNKM